ncbi:hypothetical protein R3W88_021495 [Solanum pinnatisectum]|uniref:Cysteine synthase n=1 Tax=Solanum pinnatisectum TaxID=50273 RepID=A0AAV9LTH0_9SOLN|nr:hypothetical protein R3W88_021495 [Solanum pinnatisectum]
MIENKKVKGIQTSGNMGISIAFMASMKGYKMVLKMPSYTSMERRGKMRAFRKAYELLESTPNAFMLQQFYNPSSFMKLKLINVFSVLL